MKNNNLLSYNTALPIAVLLQFPQQSEMISVTIRYIHINRSFSSGTVVLVSRKETSLEIIPDLQEGKT
jgi:hypothetical protein